MARIGGFLILATMLAVLLIPDPAMAQGRDKGLAAVQDLTAQLIERTKSNSASYDQVWAGVQALTDALHRFTLAETEIRADEKVAPPALTALRPGQAAKDTSTIPGEKTSLSNVPTPWFNLQVTHAKAALDSVRDGVEKSLPNPDLADRLHAVFLALDYVNRPPA